MNVQANTIVTKLVRAMLLYALVWCKLPMPQREPPLTWGHNTDGSLQDEADNGQAIAVAHSILVIAYHLIARQETYRNLGANYFDSSRPEATAKRLVKHLEQLGHQVTLQPQNSAVVT